MNKKSVLINSFKKSIESTVKAISKNPNLTLLFGENNVRDESNVSMPQLSNENFILEKNTIRGTSDSISLIKRYHNLKLHKSMAPVDEKTEKIFTETEFLRCELLGSKKYPGIKKNLYHLDKLKITESLSKEKKLSPSETFKLIIKSQILNTNISKDLLKISDPIAEKLIKVLKQNKIELKSNIQNQTNFSKKVLDLIKLVESENKSKEEELNEDKNEDEENDKIEENNNNNPDNIQQYTSEESDQNDKSSQIEKSESFNLDDEDEKNDASNSSTDYNDEFAENSTSNYKIFTKEFDSTTMAENLCENEDVIKLRKQLDIQTEKLDSTITILANKLQRKLLSKQTRWWEFDLEEGFLDSGKLSRVIISPDNSLSYKKEKDTEFKDTVVSLLIDNSGSMRGRPITIAAISTDILVKTLERCGIKVEVLGFTTKTWKGGRAREQWVKENKPHFPGRLNELLHIIYKNADTPARRTKKNFGIMLKEGLLKENIDGEALEWAYKRLINRNEKRKILMVISDGAPVDDSTLSSNKSAYLDYHLKNVINFIEKKTPIELLAIGIGHDVTRYYNKAVTILDVDDLGRVMSKQLIELF